MLKEKRWVTKETRYTTWKKQGRYVRRHLARNERRRKSNLENKTKNVYLLTIIFSMTEKLIRMTWLLTFSECVEQIKEWRKSAHIYWSF